MSSTRSIESRPRSSSRFDSGRIEPPPRARAPMIAAAALPCGSSAQADAGCRALRPPRCAALATLLPQPAFDLVTLEFARRRSRQRLEPDVVAEHALVRRQMNRLPFELEAKQIARVDDLALAHQVHVRDDDGIQPFGRRIVRRPVSPSTQISLTNGGLPVIRLDLLRVDVLAGREDDHFFLAAGDREPAARVDAARGRR